MSTIRYVIRVGKITYLLGQGVYSIGRHPDCSIVLTDPEVSRRHAAIVGSGDRFFIVDLRSANGVHVNDKNTLECSLDSGDEIVLGSTRLDFFSEGEDQPLPLDSASEKGDKKKAKAKESASVGEFLAENMEVSNRLKETLEEAFSFLRYVGSLPRKETLIDRCLNFVREFARADRVYLVIFEKDIEIERYVEEILPHEGADALDGFITRLAHYVTKKNEPVVFGNDKVDKYHTDDERPQCQVVINVRAGFAAPINVPDGEIRGALLTFTLLPTDRVFEELEEDMVVQFAASLGIALRNIKYLEESTEN